MKTKELIQTLAPLSKTHVATAPMQDIKVSDRRITVADRTVNLNLNNLVTFNSALPIPVDYVRRTPVSLMVPHTKHWLKEGGDQPLTIITDDEGKITAATTREVVPYRPQELVEAIADTVKVDDWEVYNVTAEAFRFLAITDRAIEPRVGDITKAGVEFAGSLFGLPPLQASLMTYRLVCSNGAIHTAHSGVFKYTGGNGNGNIGDWVNKAINGALDGAEHVFESLEESTRTPVDPEMIENLDGILRQVRFPKRHRAMARIRASQPETVYDLIQELTFVATHETPGRTNIGVFYRRRSGQAIAGAMLGRLSSCSECHQVILKDVGENGLNGHDADAEANTVEGEYSILDEE